MDEVIGKTAQWLLTNGVLGVTTLISMFVAGYLYREREKERVTFQAQLDARDNAHKVEVAQWVKLHLDLQNERLEDQRASSASVSQSVDLLKTLLDAATRGGRVEKVS